MAGDGGDPTRVKGPLGPVLMVVAILAIGFFAYRTFGPKPTPAAVAPTPAPATTTNATYASPAPGDTSASGDPTGNTIDEISDAVEAVVVGDCAHVSASGFRELQKLDCSQPHNTEVVAVQEDPSAKGTPLPDTPYWDKVNDTVCSPAALRYLGPALYAASDSYVAWESQSAWDDGARRVECLVVKSDGSDYPAGRRGHPAA